MSAHFKLAGFLRDERGAVTVDYTVIGAAAVGMAMSAAAILTGGIQDLTSRIDQELRTRQLSDDFVGFVSSHFEPLYELGSVTEQMAYDAFVAADLMMNQDIIDMIEEGIQLAQAGQISDAQMAQLFALASVAYQRNILDDAILEQYFEIGG